MHDQVVLNFFFWSYTVNKIPSTSSIIASWNSLESEAGSIKVTSCQKFASRNWLIKPKKRAVLEIFESPCPKGWTGINTSPKKSRPTLGPPPLLQCLQQVCNAIPQHRWLVQSMRQRCLERLAANGTPTLPTKQQLGVECFESGVVSSVLIFHCVQQFDHWTLWMKLLLNPLAFRPGVTGTAASFQSGRNREHVLGTFPSRVDAVI